MPITGIGSAAVDVDPVASLVTALTAAASATAVAGATALSQSVGRGVRDNFDPARMSGLVARWRADSVSGSDGSAVASWTDSVNGIAVSQGTSAQQPVLKTGSNGIGGKPVVRFLKTSTQLLTQASVPAAFPSVGPLTVVSVIRPTTSSGRARFITCSASATGWGAGMNGGSALMTVFGKADYTVPSNGMVATNGNACIQFAQLNTNNSIGLGANNLYPDYSVAGQAASTGTPAIYVGAAHAASDLLDGDIAELLVFNRALSTQDRHQLIRYLGGYYGIRTGTQYNAATKDTIPTTTETGVVTEPSLLYFTNGWKGYKYWLAFVRYDNVDSNAEEPGIVVSNTGDGTDWVVPPGLTNPISTDPATGHLADPAIRMSPDGSTMYLTYTRQATGTDGVALKSSTDGVSWSSETVIVSVADGITTMESKLAWDGTQWNLFTWNNSSTALYMERRTATTITGTYSAAQRVNFTKPTNHANQTGWWHGDVLYLNGVFLMACTDGGGSPQTTSRMVWWGTSTDGVNFRVDPTPILAPSDISVTNWDQSSIYRMCMQLDATGKNLLVYYAAYNNSLSSGQHFIGHTTIPVAEIP